MQAAGRFWFKAKIIGIRKYAASRPAAAVSPESLLLAMSFVRQHRSVVMVKAVCCRWRSCFACWLAFCLSRKARKSVVCVCVCEM